MPSEEITTNTKERESFCLQLVFLFSVVIEAKLYDGTPKSNREIIDWCKGSDTPAFTDTEIRNCCHANPDGFDYPVLKINTLEGDHIVRPGEYVIKGVAGDFYPCKNDIFKATYEPIND